ncbi:hypothetical protein ACI491_000999 [Cronobacter dublinensis]
MSEISKEALTTACAEKVKQLEFSVKQGAFDSVRQELETELAIARVALLALRGRAEPVVCPKCGNTGLADSGGVQPWGEPILIECDCTAPPAPVVLDLSLLDSLAGEFLNNAMNNKGKVKETYTWCAHRMAETVRDCRAAMLATPSSKKE